MVTIGNELIFFNPSNVERSGLGSFSIGISSVGPEISFEGNSTVKGSPFKEESQFKEHISSNSISGLQEMFKSTSASSNNLILELFSYLK